MTKDELAKMIDHTAIRAATSKEDVERTCGEAVDYGFGTVCVAPVWVWLALEKLAGTGVRVGTVAGFPHGDSLTPVKCLEANTAIEEGADEIDMVLAVGRLKSDEEDAVRMDIASVAQVVHRKPGAVVKVILETPLLTQNEISLACRLAVEAGADFVKTATGFAGGGATVEAVRLMRETVGDRAGVKAAGGISDYNTAKAMIDAGANRIGASASVAILESFFEPR